MRDSRRFLLILVTGLLLFAGTLTAVFEMTEPAQAVAVDVPLSTPTTTSTTTTEPPVTTTSPPVTAAAPAVAKPRAAGAPVRPPSNPYALEPILEVGRIRIPKIGLDHKVMHGISLRNIDHGPSHWPGTAWPGEVGNSVFAGHRVTHTKPFRHIDQLVPGDEVFFIIKGVESRYLVTGHEIVYPDRLDIVNPTPTATATIFACHPPGSAKQRYVVRMALAPPESSAPAPAATPSDSEAQAQP